MKLRTQLQKVFCKIGLHKWKYDHKLKRTNTKFTTYTITHTRRCTECQIIQYKEDIQTYTGYYEGVWTHI